MSSPANDIRFFLGFGFAVWLIATVAFRLVYYLYWHVLRGTFDCMCTTLGLPVLAIIVFMLQNGQTVPLPQIALFALLSLTGLALVTRFIRAIPPSASTTQPHAGAETQTD